MYAPLKKGTLLIHSGSLADPDKKHLFVILTDPVGPDELVLLASFSTFRTEYFCDDTCLVEGNKKEHEFITDPSFIRYQLLRIETAAKLVAGVSSKVMTPSYPAKDHLFERICAGVFASPFAARKFQVFLQRARDDGC